MVLVVKRSPNYPRVSLERALELARKVYDSAYQSKVDSNTAIGLMGFQVPSGPARAALAGLKQYGLLEGRDEELRITPLAVRILVPSNEKERGEGIKEAGNAPQFYVELRNQFGGVLPSDQVLTSYLVRTHDFNPNGAEFFIRILRNNQAYMERFSYFTDATKPSEEIAESAVAKSENLSKEPRHQEGRPVASVDDGGETMVFRVSPTCIARVTFIGHATQSAIEKLIAYLNLAKDGYVAG